MSRNAEATLVSLITSCSLKTFECSSCNYAVVVPECQEIEVGVKDLRQLKAPFCGNSINV